MFNTREPSTLQVGPRSGARPGRIPCKSTPTPPAAAIRPCWWDRSTLIPAVKFATTRPSASGRFGAFADGPVAPTCLRPLSGRTRPGTDGRRRDLNRRQLRPRSHGALWLTRSKHASKCSLWAIPPDEMVSRHQVLPLRLPSKTFGLAVHQTKEDWPAVYGLPQR